MNYNFFFNMHIPKTGGTYFRNNILKPNEINFHKNGISTPPVGGHGTNTTLHWCWYPEFTKENSYIYTNLRDPVKRIVSHFAWQAYKCVFYGYTNYKYEDINQKNFYKWIEKNYNTLTNFQSKNITYFDNNLKFYEKAGKLTWKDNDVPQLDHGFFKENFKKHNINKINLIDNINRINLIVRSEDLKSINNQEIVIKKIFNNLNINVNNLIINSDYANENGYSEFLFNSLSKKQKNELYEMSKIDSEIYFSDNLFFIPGKE